MYLGTAILGVVILAGVFGPWIVDYDPVATNVADRLLPPGSLLSDGSAALLGTDQVGREVGTLVIVGARVSLIVGIATVLIAGVLGSLLGLIAGYVGGKTDGWIMRLADVQLALPSILLALLLAAVLGFSILNVVIALAVARWVLFARVARGTALSIRARGFVENAQAMGASHIHVLRWHISRLTLGPLIVLATVEFGYVVIAEAALSFLGLGTPRDLASWGLTVSRGRDYLDSAWWISTFPGAALALTVLGIGLLGDALRDRVDPRLAA